MWGVEFGISKLPSAFNVLGVAIVLREKRGFSISNISIYFKFIILTIFDFSGATDAASI